MLRFGVGSRVYLGGHGYGTVTEVRTPCDNSAFEYATSARGSSVVDRVLREAPPDVANALVGGLVAGGYDAERYPYRVTFDSGYCDVYGDSELYESEAQYRRAEAAYNAQAERERQARLATIREAGVTSDVAELLTHPQFPLSDFETAAQPNCGGLRITLIRRAREVLPHCNLGQAAAAVDGAIMFWEEAQV
jgi:hypothetical protein